MDWSQITRVVVLKTFSGPADSRSPTVLNFFEHSLQYILYIRIYKVNIYKLNYLYKYIYKHILQVEIFKCPIATVLFNNTLQM